MARLFTFLVVDSPGQSQQVIIWDTLEITVGRGPDRDLVIPDSEVSRQHALFRMEGQSFTVADLHTSNGTFVNGTRMSRHQLRPGDIVELGPAKIQFRQEAESPRGKNVRFASQLKGFAPFGEADEDAGNRTMLGVGGAPGLVAEQGDYSDRSPAGELQIDLGGSATPTAVVDLDPVLDENLDAVQLSSFEDAELSNLEKDADPPPRAPARPIPPPRPTPVAAPPVRRPAPAPPVEAAPQRAAPPEREPSPGDTTARATLALEIEGPRAVLKSIVSALLERDIAIPPLRLRLRRPR